MRKQVLRVFVGICLSRELSVFAIWQRIDSDRSVVDTIAQAHPTWCGSRDLLPRDVRF